MQGGGVGAFARAEQRSQTAHHRSGFLAQSQGARGGDHGLPGSYQERVLEGTAQAAEGAAHGSGRGVQASGGAGDALLGQQGVQGDREVGVKGRMSAVHRRDSISGNTFLP